MANRRGEKGEAWSPEHVEILMALDANGTPHVEISKAVGRTVNAVETKLRLIRFAQQHGEVLAPGQGRFLTPAYRETDERKHLQALYDANGYGFSWWPPSLMDRFNLLERSPPIGRPFWNAA